MIYLSTVIPFMGFVAGLLVLSAGLRLFSWRSRSRRIVTGAVGACLGYVLAPGIAVAADLIPSAFIEPRYFTEMFMGCISPIAFSMAYLTIILGALLGCVIGCTFPPRFFLPSGTIPQFSSNNPCVYDG